MTPLEASGGRDVSEQSRPYEFLDPTASPTIPIPNAQRHNNHLESAGKELVGLLPSFMGDAGLARLDECGDALYRLIVLQRSLELGACDAVHVLELPYLEPGPFT